MRLLRKTLIFSIFILLAIIPQESGVFAQGSPPAIPTIFYPQPGEAVQGFISITGSIQTESVVAYRLEFSFIDQTEGEWFLIQEGTTPLVDQTLGGWDTSAITDGEYQIRVIIYAPTDEGASFTVSPIRVRNYTPVETNTPSPEIDAPEDSSFEVTARPTETSPPPNPLPKSPENPASLSQNDLSAALKFGGISGGLIFLAYILTRRIKSPRK